MYIKGGIMGDNWLITIQEETKCHRKKCKEIIKLGEKAVHGYDKYGLDVYYHEDCWRPSKSKTVPNWMKV